MSLPNSPCGGEAKLVFNENRAKRRKEATELLKKAIALQPERAKLEKEALAFLKAGKAEEAIKYSRLVHLASRRGLEELEQQVAALSQDHWEIHCSKSGLFVHAATQEEAEATWNKACEKFKTLADCCKDPANQEEKKDADGMIIYRCSKCGVRHIPFPQG